MALLSIDDVDDGTVDHLLLRAGGLADGDDTPSREGHILGLIFLEESLRTRLGFAAAAARLGWRTVEVLERRDGPTTSPESLIDTLRTVAGYTDLLVVRPAVAIDADTVGSVPVPVINGGDKGARAEHPSQALVDLFAIERMSGPVHGLDIAICGDPSMRAGRSLLRLLARRPPRTLTIICGSSHRASLDLPGPLVKRVVFRDLDDLDDVDVLYVVGIPHASIPLPDRARLLVTREVMARLHDETVVLSPLPIIDEVADDARADPRFRAFEQSDLGLFMRMALLESLIEPARHLSLGNGHARRRR